MPDASVPLSRREAHARREAVKRPQPGRKRPRRARSRIRTREIVGSIIGYLVRGDDLNRPSVRADSSDVARLETPTNDLRERALVLAAELALDRGSWYVRVLEEGRSAGADADLGALVRMYWELQRVTGRADLRDEWRCLADTLWSGETA